MDDLEKAVRNAHTHDKRVQRARKALESAATNDLNRLHNLAEALQWRYRRFGAMRDFEERAQIVRRGHDEIVRRARKAEDTVIGDPKIFYRSNRYRSEKLAMALARRFKSFGAASDHEERLQIVREGLNDAIQYRQKAVSASVENDTDQADLSKDLASTLRERHRSFGATSDLEEAIQVGRRAKEEQIWRALKAVDASREHDPNLVSRLIFASHLLNERCKEHGATSGREKITKMEQRRLDEEIWRARNALNMAAGDDPELVRLLSDLATALSRRYGRFGMASGLEEGIEVGRKISDIPGQLHLKLISMHNLSASLITRFDSIGDTADVDEAFRLSKEVISMAKSIPKAQNYRYIRLHSLGTTLSCRYESMGQTADLEEAIRSVQEAKDMTGRQNQYRAHCLQSLAGNLLLRYQATSMSTRLEEAIECIQKAFNIQLYNLHEKGQPIQASLFDILADSLRLRYRHTGMMSDIEEATDIAQGPDYLTSIGDVDVAVRSSSHASCLVGRYERTGMMSDLEMAIQFEQKAFDMTPKNHNRQRKKHLSLLGAYIKLRYDRAELMSDLEKAIQIEREVIRMIPEVDPQQPNHLYRLGIRLMARFLKMQASTDIDEAICLEQIAVDTIPPNHPHRPVLTYSLGEALLLRWQSTGMKVDLEGALSCFGSILSTPTLSTLIRIRAGHNVVRCCAVTSDWQQAYEASDTAVRLIAKLISRSHTNSDKQHALSQVVGFTSDFAAAALTAGKEPFAALRFLEQGRGVLSSSLEEGRIDVLHLRNWDCELAERFISLRDELESSHSCSTSLVKEVKELKLYHNKYRELSWTPRANRRNEAGNEYDRLIIEIRKQTGFENFLQAPSTIEIHDAASLGPIVMINVSEYRCDAILIEQHQIRSIALPKLNIADIKTKAKGDLGSPHILKWLWNVVMNPILDALGFTQPPSDDEWPHVWWIPTGPLSNFALHAAGYHATNPSDETVLDRVMSTYSPSVNAIVYSRRRPFSPYTSDTAVLVAMEYTPGVRRLSNATEEVALISSLCKTMTLNPLEPRRYKKNVISHLAKCKLFHFAGHGYTNANDPSKSGIFLEDWQDNPFTVATLLETNVREHSPFLAYLSTCDAARIHDKFFDENIHLVSAFQLAGFRHVIGTFWKVSDELCVDMARITYEVMRDEGMTDKSVCRGLHTATRRLRRHWPKMRGKADVVVEEDQDMAQSVNKGDKMDDRFARDAIFVDDSDDDDEEDTGSLPWVPYAHFGP
ncbi:MAG: hypothetical protein Q9165_008177 [Trypethelium subeluteriae]